MWKIEADLPRCDCKFGKQGAEVSGDEISCLVLQVFCWWAFFFPSLPTIWWNPSSEQAHGRKRDGLCTYSPLPLDFSQRRLNST